MQITLRPDACCLSKEAQYLVRFSLEYLNWPNKISTCRLVLTCFITGCITVHLTSDLTGLDSVPLLIYLFGEIQTSQRGG